MRLLFLSLALLTACGPKSLLGVKNTFVVSMTANNQSASPLTVTLALEESGASDACEHERATKDADVPPKTTKDDELSLKCEHPPRNSVELLLKVPPNPEKPVQWATVAFGDEMKDDVAPGTEVRWRADQTTVRTGSVTAADWVDQNGMRSPAKEPTRVTPVTADAFAAAPVRAGGKQLQVYFAPDLAVIDIGVPATLFKEKPAAATEVDGYYYFVPKVETFAGALKLTRYLPNGKVTCDDQGCTLEPP